ncbi:MAG: sigma-54-dependent Fis family transcriptional regulator [Fibrobacter sp.]|nr:sigma-54-dependent Fis family transcriptional regulator [Fibrobacter sp.]
MDFDFLEKNTHKRVIDVLSKHHLQNFDLEALQEALHISFDDVRTYHKEECDKIRELVKGKPGELIGNTSEMKAVREQVRHIAPSQAIVLVRGNAGTGKEYIAKSLHQLSERSEKPFVVLNCSTLSEREGAASFESELFGYERGAFTGATSRRIGKAEQAAGGTLFIDEVANLSNASQVKLLEFLQDNRFRRQGSNIIQSADVRIIASTSKNLEALMQQGHFREDLYYRLNIFQIALPGLCQRKTDILLLADYFIAKMNLKYGKNVARLSSPAIDMLLSYHWPGNVRELENCIEHACLVTTDVCINAYDLPPTLQTDVTSGTSLLSEGISPLSTLLDSYEREILTEALRRNHGNRSAAGRDLSISPRVMHYKIKRLGIDEA